MWWARSVLGFRHSGFCYSRKNNIHFSLLFSLSISFSRHSVYYFASFIGKIISLLLFFLFFLSLFQVKLEDTDGDEYFFLFKASNDVKIKTKIINPTIELNDARIKYTKRWRRKGKKAFFFSFILYSYAVFVFVMCVCYFALDHSPVNTVNGAQK